MKTLLPLLLLGLLTLSARNAKSDDQLPSAHHGKSLKLIWQDDFFMVTDWTSRSGNHDRMASGRVAGTPSACFGCQTNTSSTEQLHQGMGRDDK